MTAISMFPPYDQPHHQQQPGEEGGEPGGQAGVDILADQGDTATIQE